MAFRLHDTYGFPIDLTIELAAEYGVAVDRAGFEAALAEQRERSRSGRKAELAQHAELTALYQAIQTRVGDTTFLGYETTRVDDATVVAIVRDGLEYAELEAVGDVDGAAGPGATAEIVLDRTPFYAEGGGQIGDRGALTLGGEVVFEVADTQRPLGGLIVHRGTLRGGLKVGQRLVAEVDAERRARTMRNHTGTHLLHRALRNVVGERARQAGSLVTPDGLRFDFPLERGLTDEERAAIEAEVRRVIREDRPVTPAFMSMAEAIAAGADAFFDEKYGETVRTVRVEGYSHELCGGTHCRASGQVGGFVIVAERSIGTGVRRIEALTGDAADAFLGAAPRAPRARGRGRRREHDRGGARADRRAPGRAARGEAPAQGRRRRRRAPAGRAARTGRRDPGRDHPAAVRRSVRIDRRDEGLRQGPPRGRRGQRHRPRARCRGAAAVRDRRRDGRPRRRLGRRPRPAAAAHIDGKGGGRPEMAQGKGTRRDGLPAALDAIAASMGATNGASG